MHGDVSLLCIQHLRDCPIGFFPVYAFNNHKQSSCMPNFNHATREENKKGWLYRWDNSKQRKRNQYKVVNLDKIKNKLKHHIWRHKISKGSICYRVNLSGRKTKKEKKNQYSSSTFKAWETSRLNMIDLLASCHKMLLTGIGSLFWTR